MEHGTLDERSHWPLEGIRLITVLKIEEITVFHHCNENPYYQIIVDGFVLDSFGVPAQAGVELSADDGDIDSVRLLQDLYCVGSLHWLDTRVFGTMGGAFQFYTPETTLVPSVECEMINEFFTGSQGRGQTAEAHDLSQLEMSEITSLTEIEDGTSVRVCCVVTDVREVTTKRGTTMCFATAEDRTGTVSITIFGDIYPKVSHLIKSERSVNITGRLEISEHQTCILVSCSTGIVTSAN